MRIKNKIAVIFMLLACLTMLTHAILPHHHHDTMACFFTTHHCDEDSEEDHSHGKHEEHHDRNSHEHGNFNTCFLKDVVNKGHKINIEQPVFDCILYSVELANITSTELFNYPKPYLFNYFSPFIRQSCGLRAPPFFT